MAVFFGMPDDDARNLLAQAMREWHPALTKLGVKVQIIMAASDSDTPAVKHGGYAALATIRVVPLKDRLTKQYDAEMLVSRHDWETATEAERLALLDHELQHIDPVKKEKKQRRGYKGPKQYYTPLDDLGRPKLKLRLGDWSAGDGFAAVVHRHGDNAIEFENLRRASQLAERAKSGEWQPDDQGGEIVETVDRDDLGTQLTFDDVYQELTAAVADLADKGGTVTFRPGEIRQEPAEPAPAFEVGGPREPAIVHCDKCKVTFDATGREKCPSCSKPLAKPEPVAGTKLADLDNFPVAVFDLLFPGISTLETLLESVEQYRVRVGLEDLPLRNQLVTYFVTEFKAKMKPAEHAAKAITDHLEPKPEQPNAHSVADTGIALVIRTEGSAPLLKKLKKTGVNTIGELCEWVEREYADQGGMADRNGSGLYAAFCALTSARAASVAADAVQSFLRTHNLMAAAPVAAEPAPSKPKPASTAIHLRLIPGFPTEAANHLGERGVQTLADLDAQLIALRKLPSRGEADRYAMLEALEVSHDVLYQAGDAMVDYEAAAKVEPTPAKKPAPKKRKGTAK